MNAPLIELEDVTIIREGRTILDHVSLRIEEGEHTAIVGPNGCGKSTLIKALTREIYPYAGRGSVRIGGRDRWTIAELRTVLGVVSNEPKEPLLGSPTGLQIAVSGLIGTYGVLVQHPTTPEMFERGREALRAVEAEHLADQPVETMSAGEHRRCFIARALVSRPKAVVLDEPTTGLDLRARYEFLTTLRRLAQGSTTLILVTHHLEEIVPEIGRTLLMKDGHILVDGPTSTTLSSAALSKLFDLPIEVTCGNGYEARVREVA